MTHSAIYLGYSDQRPMFGRFTYAEKMEYWALVWGMFVMASTGLMAWFKVGVGERVPGWWIDVAITIHFYEAVLATLAIIVWHLYGVMFDPDAYPMNWAWYRRQDVDRALRARTSAGRWRHREGSGLGRGSLKRLRKKQPRRPAAANRHGVRGQAMARTHLVGLSVAFDCRTISPVATSATLGAALHWGEAKKGKNK